MKTDCFLDTNILIYAALGRRDDKAKHDIAKRILATQRFGLSGQVLAEFYVRVMRDKDAPALTVAETDRWMAVMKAYPLVAVDAALVDAGIAIARRYQIHYYDAAILAAAERLSADLLYTEDLNHGQRYGTVLVQNPFRDP